MYVYLCPNLVLVQSTRLCILFIFAIYMCAHSKRAWWHVHIHAQTCIHVRFYVLTMNWMHFHMYICIFLALGKKRCRVMCKSKEQGEQCMYLRRRHTRATLYAYTHILSQNEAIGQVVMVYTKALRKI